MRKLVFLPVAVLLALCFLLPGQDGPKKDVGETVARPRKKGDPVEADQPKIPSKLPRKDQLGMSDQPDFKVDSSVVSVDVAVLDNKGRFIPHIPKGNFRIMEDGVPQKLTNFSMGEAPPVGSAAANSRSSISRSSTSRPARSSRTKRSPAAPRTPRSRTPRCSSTTR